MPLDATHIESNEYTSQREEMNRADLTYTNTQADLLALYGSVEQQTDSIVQPITTPEQIAEILAHPEQVHCIVIAWPTTLTKTQMQTWMMQATAHEQTQFWSLDPNEHTLLKALWITFEGAWTYVFHQWTVVTKITQALSGAWRDAVTQWVKTNDKKAIEAWKQLILGNNYTDLTITTKQSPKGKYDDLTITVVPSTSQSTTAPSSTPSPSTWNATQTSPTWAPKQQPWLTETMQITNGIDVSHLNWYIEWVKVKKLDPRVYSLNGNLIPESREKFKISKNMITINGVDEWLARFDADMVYINPNGYRTGVEYQATELKLWEKLTYKLQVDASGNLRIAVAPGPELAKKYKEKKWIKRKKVMLPELPKAPTLDEIIAQIQDLLPDFEWDPDVPDANSQDPEEADAVETVQPGTLTFKWQKVNQIFTTVYGVPPEWLHDVQVTYDANKQSFRITKKWNLFSTIDNVSLQQLERWSYSLKYTEWWFSKKITHEWFFDATVDDLWRMTISWWNKTFPGWESAESPRGRALPFTPNANTVITDVYWTKRAIRKNGKVVWVRDHKWIDIGMPQWTQVNSIASWTVVDVKDHISGYGKQIVIDHGNWYKTRYAHLSAYAVKLWQKVVAWQKIAESWKTGSRTWKTGLHLHFEIIENGSTVNPAKYIDFTRFDRFKKLRGTRPHVKNTIDANNIAVWTTEVGMASYYDDHGNTTASWIVFDQMGTTCAHNVYPFGTKLKVTNLETGLSEEVTVEDTWNFDQHGKIIDLSKGTMLRIWWTEQQWVIRVRTEVIKIGNRKNTKSWAWWANSWGNTPPKQTPTPSPTTPPQSPWNTTKPTPTPNNPPSSPKPVPNTPPKTPEIGLMKQPPAYVAAAVTFWWKSFTSYSPIMAWNPWASTKNAPRGWLVEVKNGKVTIHTQEWVKTVSSNRTLTVAWKNYTVNVQSDNTNKAYPNAARFHLVAN